MVETYLKDGIDSWETAMFLYNAALKEVGTKLEILNDEFVHIHNYNPIEYIKSRIKKPESIVKKLKRNIINFQDQSLLYLQNQLI